LRKTHICEVAVRDGTVQDFSGPDRPWPTTSSPFTARGPRTFRLFHTGPLNNWQICLFCS